MSIKQKTKKASTARSTKTTKNSLRTWLFDRPAIFSICTFLVTSLICVTYAIISALFNINVMGPLVLFVFLGFCWTIYRMIKKLPHDDMYRDDFIAISNGCSLIAIFIPLITLLFLGFDVNMLRYKFMWLYVFQPGLLWLLAIIAILLYLYLFGVAVSNVYAKYKRAVQIGISKRLIIASMPFTFFLMWTPGYLIPDTKNNSNLNIKSRWYSKFNKWVVANTTNTLFIFLTFVLFTNVFSGMLSLLLTGSLLVIYALWNLKYKDKFIKQVNNGYALTAVALNISILIAVLLSMMASGTNL